jgi:hypothetical protein
MTADQGSNFRRLEYRAKKCQGYYYLVIKIEVQLPVDTINLVRCNVDFVFRFSIEHFVARDVAALAMSVDFVHRLPRDATTATAGPVFPVLLGQIKRMRKNAVANSI